MHTNRIPVVLHAHFYQPPRDNPWTESVERESTAAPFHDWNDRIESECYGANARARVFGEHGRIVDIINNYEFLSFNIGPTLFSWMTQHAPGTAKRIVEADRASVKRLGHGNAIAQLFSHAILPLCSARDKKTQIIWGLADFRHRFGRDAEAIWLAETACDIASAEALAEHGMRYIILSPHQAERVFLHGSGEAKSVADGSIDPRRPYRLDLPSGKCIVCFFYDGPIAHAMSFEDVLDTSRKLAERLKGSADLRRGSKQIVHAATDGETFGHHHRQAERALSYFLTHEAHDHNLLMTNYGAFLDTAEVTDRVELKGGPDGEGTAWSCSHGIGRWRRDCGCNAGRNAGGHQKFRGPLREALDLLNDFAGRVFEEFGSPLLRNVWDARNDYISAILEPTRDRRDDFLARHATHALTTQERVRCFKLLEAQRMSLLMYASCGWFFDDIAGLETVQILKYAARCIELVEGVSGLSIRPQFLDKLSQARSNVESEGTGADVFHRHVLPCELTNRARIAQQASRRLFGEAPDLEIDSAFRIETISHERLTRGSYALVMGRSRLIRERTEQCEELTWAAASLTDRDMHCGVIESSDDRIFDALQTEARQIFERPTPAELIRLVDRHLGSACYSMHDLRDPERTELHEKMLTGLLERLGKNYAFLYDEHRRTISTLEAAGVEVPQELQIVAAYTLARRLDAAVLEATEADDPSMVRTALAIAREARALGVELQVPRASARLSQLLREVAADLEKDPNAENAQKLTDLILLTRALGLRLQLDKEQDIVFDLLKAGQLCAITGEARVAIGEALSLSV